MFKKVAADMVVVSVSFDICEISTKDVEGSNVILEIASFIHRALLIPSYLEVEGYITPPWDHLGVLEYFPSS